VALATSEAPSRGSRSYGGCVRGQIKNRSGFYCKKNDWPLDSCASYADIRIRMSEVQGDFQLSFQADPSGSPAGLPEVREQEDGEADEQVRDDEGAG
jgi:hypothetical protein